MKKKQLTLAYSTCPNDTFIFHALAERIVDTRGLEFKIALADVEALNQAAAAGVYDISKLSFAAIGHLNGKYRILESGAALGRGCGPMVVARSGFRAQNLSEAKIAVPGYWTTANLLLGLYLGKKIPVQAMTFDRIMPAVVSGAVDAGVIIHEGRFTYPEYGLRCLVDLGRWWEDETGYPIPLGAIAVREDVSPEIAANVSAAIQQSIAYAYDNPGASDCYIQEHAQELSRDVIRQHIELYVNDFSRKMGPEGHAAVEALFSRAVQNGIFPEFRCRLYSHD